MLNGSALPFPRHILNTCKPEICDFSSRACAHSDAACQLFLLSYTAFAWLRNGKASEQIYECRGMDMSSQMSSCKKTKCMRQAPLLFLASACKDFGKVAATCEHMAQRSGRCHLSNDNKEQQLPDHLCPPALESIPAFCKCKNLCLECTLACPTC